MINFDKFYKKYRAVFGRIKKEKTVESIDAILTEINKNWNDERFQTKRLEKAAYMFATVHHEVGHEMIPIIESMYYTTARRIRQVWPSRFSLARARKYTRNPAKLGNTVYSNRLGNGDYHSGDGYKYRGRGIGAQLTGKVNYEKFSKILNIDLVNNPNLAMDPDVGAKILFYGLTRGNLTGVSLSNYINSMKTDFRNARRVVNADVGLNGRRVARTARKFLKVLKYAYEPGVNHIPAPKKIEKEIDIKEQQDERKKQVVEEAHPLLEVYEGLKRFLRIE